MKLYTMAFRNLGRAKRRTFLASLSVCIAMAAVTFLDGFTGGFVQNIVTNFTKDDVGHVQVVTKAYRAREKFMPVAEYVRDADRAAAAIAAIPALRGEIARIEERIRFGVLLSNGGSSKSALCVAGDPEAERSLLMLDRSIASGSYLTGPGQAIVGSGIARDLGLKVGDVLRVVTEKTDYGLGYKRFSIVGVFSTDVNSLDGNLFQVGLEDARDLLGMAGGATQIIVMLRDYRRSEAAARSMQAALDAAGMGGLVAVPWTKSGSFASLMLVSERMFAWIFVIIAFLGAFVIANVMMMVVLERKREIGILKSMGMPRREILFLFLLEGALLGALGSAVGVGLGFGLCVAFSAVGMDFSSAMSSFSWPMDNVLYPTANPVDALLLFLLGVAVAAVVAFLPSRSAATMDPIEAIRSA